MKAFAYVAIMLGALGCATDGRSEANASAPIEECEAYVAAYRACFRGVAATVSG